MTQKERSDAVKTIFRFGDLGGWGDRIIALMAA
jgi:hypothetical protein